MACAVLFVWGLGGAGNGLAGWMGGLFGCLDGQGEGPDAVVVGAVGVAVGDFTNFGELEFLGVEFVEGVTVEGDTGSGLSHPLF